MTTVSSRSSDTPGATLALTHLLVTIYITKPDQKNPRTKARAGKAVLFLTDVFGLALPENKLCVVTPPFLLLST